MMLSTEISIYLLIHKYLHTQTAGVCIIVSGHIDVLNRKPKRKQEQLGGKKRQFDRKKENHNCLHPTNLVPASKELSVSFCCNGKEGLVSWCTAIAN